jgi:ribosome maturation factor RimP
VSRRSDTPEIYSGRHNELDSDPEALRQLLLELVNPVVADYEASLVDVEIVGRRNSLSIRLLVHKDPGITLNLCESISREVGDLLDVEDPVSGRYRLEVTSPGLDRPLVTDSDFARASAKQLKVLLQSGRSISGRLADWDQEAIELQVEKEIVDRIPRSEIMKATIEVDM